MICSEGHQVTRFSRSITVPVSRTISLIVYISRNKVQLIHNRIWNILIEIEKNDYLKRNAIILLQC